MDVRIGVTYTAKELDVELPDDADGAALQSEIEDAVAGDATMLWITDRKGRRIGVPTDKLAYVEIGSPESPRRIGFGG